MTIRYLFLSSRLILFLFISTVVSFYIINEISKHDGGSFFANLKLEFFSDPDETRKNHRVYEYVKASGYSVNDLKGDVIINHTVPLLKLKFSEGVRRKFKVLMIENENGNSDYYRRNNKWNKAILEFNGEELRASVKLHGYAPFYHRDGKFRSLSVKIKDGKSVFGAKRFNLIVFRRLNGSFTGSNSSLISDTLNVLDQSHRLVRVKTNNGSESFFYFEHRLNNDYMETKGRPSYIRLGTPTNKSSILSYIIKGKNNESDMEYFMSQAKKDLPSLKASANSSLDEFNLDSRFHSQILSRYVSLNESAAEMELSGFLEFFDLDYLIRFEAARFLGGQSGHCFTNSNLIIFYDTSSGRFFPSFHRDCDVDYLARRVHLERPTYQTDLYWYPIFNIFQRSDLLRLEKHKLLYKIISSGHLERKLETKLSKLKLRTENWLEKPPVSMAASKYSPSVILENIKYLKNMYSEPGKVFYSIKKVNKDIFISIKSSSYLPIEINRLALISDSSEIGLKYSFQDDTGDSKVHTQTISRKTFDNASVHFRNLQIGGLVHPSREIKERKYKIILRNVGNEGAINDLSFVNAITQKEVEKVQYYEATFKINNTEEKIPAITYPEFLGKIENNSFTLKAGNHFIEDTLILPFGINLIVEPGANLIIDPNTSIKVNGGLAIKGTKKNPVKIRSKDQSKSFGTIAILGNNKTTVDINHLIMSGGSEDYIDGAFFSGALSIHDHEKVMISNTIITNSHADDGLNVKRAQVIIKDSEFHDNKADQVDLDNVIGTIEKTSFFNSSEKTWDLNGDGLDLSFSVASISNCSFNNLSDKGLSVGEKSTILLSNSNFTENNIGIAAKDESVTYISDTGFSRNNVPISLYQKKEIFGGAKVFISKKVHSKIKEDISVDKLSKVYSLPNHSQALTSFWKDYNKSLGQEKIKFNSDLDNRFQQFNTLRVPHLEGTEF